MPIFHDADGRCIESRSLEEKMRVRDLAELITESTGASTK
jgi:hypothetical protein